MRDKAIERKHEHSIHRNTAIELERDDEEQRLVG